jgi:hypothetical protein
MSWRASAASMKTPTRSRDFLLMKRLSDRAYRAIADIGRVTFKNALGGKLGHQPSENIKEYGYALVE